MARQQKDDGGAAVAQSDSGMCSVAKLDMVRVMTETHVTEGIAWPDPFDRVLFRKDEVIRLVGQKGGVCFAIPYFADPEEYTGENATKIPKHVWETMFRELNPAERAYLGLPLFGGWDLVTRHGWLGATNAHMQKWVNAREEYAKKHGGGRLRDESGEGDEGPREIDWQPEPERDPRKFTIGKLFFREVGVMVTRALHPWPLVARIHERRVGEIDEADWRPVILRGRAALAVNPDEAQELVRQAQKRETDALAAARGRGEQYIPHEYRLTYSVDFPEPYDPIPECPLPERVEEKAGPGTLSYRFTVSRRSGHLGYVFVPVTAPDPWQAAMAIARKYDDGGHGMECYNRTPSKMEPCDELCELRAAPKPG